MRRKFAFLIGLMLVGRLAFATVSGNYTPVNSTADGNTTEYSFDFKVPSSSDLTVQLVNASTLNATDMALGTDYNVTLSTSTPGGHIDFNTAPATGNYVRMYRDLAVTQPTDLPSVGLLRADQIEGAIDRVVLLLQQQKEEIDRAIKVPMGSGETPDYAEILSTAAAEAESYANLSLTRANIALGYANNSSAFATDAQNYASSAAASAENATDAVSSIGLPIINSSDAYKFLQVNSTGEGYATREIFPVGYVYISTASTNPATLFGYGTWTAIGTGRTLVGINASDTDFDTVKETGGAKTVTLTANQSGLPSHRHQNYYDAAGDNDANNYPEVPYLAASADGAAGYTSYSGGTNASEAHSVMDPYIVVYMFERTA